MDWMEYVYAGLWLICGLLLLFRFGKESRVFYALGGFFLFLGAWWLANIFLPVNLFEGAWLWVLRGLSACALALAVYGYYAEKKKTLKAKEEQEQILQEEAENEPEKASALPEQADPYFGAEGELPENPGDEKPEAEPEESR